MKDKVSSEIIQISLNDATYENSGISIQPTLVNFFFGNNGTGKTTISKAIKTDIGTTWKDTKSASDYKIHVYNQDFIKANLQNFNNMPGVFTVNEVNIEIQNKVDGLTVEKEKASEASRKAEEEKKKNEKSLSSALTLFQNDCWEKTANLRTDFKGTLDKKGIKKTFAEGILEVATPKEHDRDALKRMYDAAYSTESKVYAKFNAVSGITVLDNLNGSEILSKIIVNRTETPFAEFIKAMNSAMWVRKGHEQFNDISGGKCPYCQQKLPDNFEDEIKACFDEQYQIDTKAVDDFYNLYKNTANAIFAPLQSIPAALYPGINLTVYTDKLNALRGVIAENLRRIAEKKTDYSIIVTIESTASLLQGLSDIIMEFNKLIADNNAVLESKPKKTAECKKNVWELLAYTVRDEIKRYKTTKAALDKEINALSTQFTTYKNDVKNITGEISDLNKQIVNTKATIDSINALLRDSGFQGFSMREKVGSPNVYEIIRPNGNIAENLSEGERNFIAFLYFYHLVRGSETADEVIQDKIVVIDDPVSSMDSSSLFIVSALVREMIDICENNAEEREYIVQGNFIKQIFILTHNAYFHREVTYNQVKHYQYVNFYLIKKADNKSSIKLFEDRNPDSPTEMININPVKNSYAALWEEYKTTTAAIPLMNIIRRILEYYFLQLCGYDGETIRQCILKKNKNKFISLDENGKEDCTQYQMVSAMLSYISANSIGMNDGLNYVEDCVDVEQCKETFKMIFTLMNQEQHYKMMMGI